MWCVCDAMHHSSHHFFSSCPIIIDHRKALRRSESSHSTFDKSLLFFVIVFANFLVFVYAQITYSRFLRVLAYVQQVPFGRESIQGEHSRRRSRRRGRHHIGPFQPPQSARHIRHSSRRRQQHSATSATTTTTSAAAAAATTETIAAASGRYSQQ